MSQRLKIVITGAGGMLGSALCDVLGENDEVFPFSHTELDIADSSQIEGVLKNVRPDLLINAAAYTKVDDCERNSQLAFQVNGQAVGNLARACHSYPIFLVHFSTDYVFDGQKRTPYLEDDSTGPLNVYGASKLKGEQKIVEVGGENFLIVRTSWLYGPHGPNFVDKILELASQRPELQVVDDQVGAPTYTYDVAKAVRFLIEKRAKGIIHVTNRGISSWYEFAVEILKVAGLSHIPIRKITSDQMKRPAARPAYSALSMDRLEKVYGYQMRGWKEALKEYLRYRIENSESRSQNQEEKGERE